MELLAVFRYTYNGENIAPTLTPSFLIGSSLILLVTGLIMDQIRLYTLQLLALEKLKMFILHLMTAKAHAAFIISSKLLGDYWDPIFSNFGSEVIRTGNATRSGSIFGRIRIFILELLPLESRKHCF